MFAYALIKADRLDLAPGAADAGETAVDALATRAMRRRPDGTAELAQICQVAGLGGFLDRYRDGSPEYYLSEPVVPDDPKGVGPLMMASAEQHLAAGRSAPPREIVGAHKRS
jgi:unsaturated rhamnogalacturonyl hydrolase